MPHIILESSDNISNKLPFEDLFNQLHKLLADTLPTQISSCKSRVITHDRYFVGTDFKNNVFIHLTMKIMPGRSNEVKQTVGKEALEILKKLSENSNENHISLSVEVIDLDENYFKTVL